ncbi:MAG: hypothetical protein MCS20_01345 [Candidatus Phytoplasma mali]|nr:hypothetical protein [Candidatus Phytoplasma australiense]MCG7202043.1 hypothetical protein [Candidatus Phytoplasma mali]MCZ8632211.1 hypothetical protein [Spiroplasma sp. Tabriz.8]
MNFEEKCESKKFITIILSGKKIEKFKACLIYIYIYIYIYVFILQKKHVY